mgnify:CR=1 FL=1
MDTNKRALEAGITTDLRDRLTQAGKWRDPPPAGAAAAEAIKNREETL